MRIWINDTHAGRRSWLSAIKRTIKRAQRVRAFNLPGALRSQIANRFIDAIQNKVPWGKISWHEQERLYIEEGIGYYGYYSQGPPEYYARINPQERLVGQIPSGPGLNPAGSPRFLEGMFGRFRTRHAGADVYVGTLALMNPYPHHLPTRPIMYYFDHGWVSGQPKDRRMMKPRPVRWWITKQFSERLRNVLVNTWRQVWRPLMEVD